MPELPDVVVYLERLDAKLAGRVLEKLRVASVFVVRSFDPPMSALVGKRVLGFRRLGKRLVFVFEDELFLVMHLMIAGRLQFKEKGAAIPGKLGLAAFDFDSGTLLFTEAGTKKRASLYLVRGQAGLGDFDRGGVEPLSAPVKAYQEALRRENHTLKRSLTDPRLFSGIGNAYSDEILFDAQLSPVKLTSRLTDDEIERLATSTKKTLLAWLERLRAEAGDGFPAKVTAFRDEMAVHGKYGKPCVVCGTKVQRIRYASNEVNYCPRCQTDGKVLADRGLSRLLGSDWPKDIDELEEREAARPAEAGHPPPGVPAERAVPFARAVSAKVPSARSRKKKP
jgi:formamidopyrimidine-DNA glycosylase